MRCVQVSRQPNQDPSSRLGMFDSPLGKLFDAAPLERPSRAEIESGGDGRWIEGARRALRYLLDCLLACLPAYYVCTSRSRQ